MSGSTINIECPKCHQKISQSLSTLEGTDQILCPGCGLAFDCKELKRGIKEAIQKAKQPPQVVKVSVKL